MDRVDQIMNQFEAHAERLFTHVYTQFESSTNTLDREKDDNVFQQSAARYTLTFKQQLTQIALDVLEQHRHSADNLLHLRELMTRKISMYVNEFRQKTMGL